MATKRTDKALQRAQRELNLVPAGPPDSQAPLGRRVRPVMPPSEEESLELRRLFWILLKRRWQILLVAIPAAIFHSAIMPVGDSLTMTNAARGHTDYGRVRLWGSVTDSLPVSVIGGYYHLDASQTRQVVAGYAERFSGMKFKVGGRTPAEDAGRR